MTPVQRITVTCRQTGEQAGRLRDWLEHDQAYALQHRGLRDEIDGAIGRLAEIRHAVDLPPSVGVVGAQGAGKTELIAALASLRQHALVAEFSGGQMALNVIDAVLPPPRALTGIGPGIGPGIGLVLRFSAIEGPVAPKGLPVRLGLLSQTDVVRIITRSYHTHFPAAHRLPPTAARMAEAFSLAERALIAQSVVGLSARDIADLRDHLHGFFPDSATLRALAAGGYWDQLGELAAHLPDLERRRLLALLWNEESGLTQLFGRLCDGLERLGHAPEVFAPIEALATKERGTGWVVPHARSIVAASTVQALGHGSDEKLRIAGRYGQIAEIGRAVMAGLAAELPLRLASPQLAALKPAQILEFPSPPPLVDFDPDDFASDPGHVGAESGPSLLNCAALFAHTKAAYLLERACQRHDITSLVVCIDPLTAHDDDMSAAVAEWVETAQGSEPHQRERLQTGLFVVGTKLDQLGEYAGQMGAVDAAAAMRQAAQRWGDQLGAKLSDDLGADQDWPLEWTPGRAFRNIYLCRRPADYAASDVGSPVGPRGTEPAMPGTGMAVLQAATLPDGVDADSVLKAPNLVRYVDNPGLTWSGATVATDGGVGHLLSGLVTAVQAATKHRQLNTHLVDLRRRLRARMLRLHLSNDPSQIAEWRRQLAIVAQGRLQRVVQADRMHVLQLGLGVTAHELTVLYVASQAANQTGDQTGRMGSQFGAQPGAGGGRRGAAAATCERLAMATVEYWLQAIRQVARSTRFCRSVGVSQPVLQHIVDELSIGALRLGIAAQLADTFHRASQAPTQQPLAEPYFAAAAAQLIGCYVERLTMPGTTIGAMSAAQASHPPKRYLAPVADVGVGSFGARTEETGGTASGLMQAGTARAWGVTVGGRGLGAGPAASDLDWPSAYASLVEANIAAAAHLTGGADRDRELGELLAGFLASPLEVEP
jgi:hypothetical protein